MAYEIKKFPFEGTIDADGHILEPPDLWENYLEEKYRPRALRIGVDDDGFEYLEIDQQPSKRSRKGSLGLLGAMGDDDMRPRPDRRYADNMPFGSCDPGERLELMSQENLEACLLYPTIGLLWEVELTDPELSARLLSRLQPLDCRLLPRQRRQTGAHCPAHSSRPSRLGNGTRKSGERRLQRRLGQPVQSQQGDSRRQRARRAVCQMLSSSTCPWPSTRRSRHTAPPRYSSVAARRPRLGRGDLAARHRATGADLVFLARHPRAFSGSQARRSGSRFRLDRRAARSPRRLFANRSNIKRTSASELFRRQCFISGDPDETAAPHIIDHVGSDCFMWATDYPHPDHPHTWVDDLTRYAEALSPETRAQVLGGNVKRVYCLD